MNLQAAQQTFVAECHELLADMESALLTLEKNPQDPDAIGAVFRAAHTIKGSAGAFGFDAIVEFTHVMESVLDEVRAARLSAGPDLSALLLTCGDHVNRLIDCLAQADPAAAFEAARQAGAELIAQLNCYLEAQMPAPGLPQIKGERNDNPDLERLDGGTVASGAWHISIRFGRNVLRNGMDPLSFIRYLATLGQIVSISTLFDALPEAAAMDPESCYLGVEIDFSGSVDKETIEGAFEYVRDDSAIRILPPHSRLSDYVRLINELPEDKTMLGELLVAGGVLTRRELDECLRLQRRLEAEAGGAPEHAHRIGELLVGQGMVQNELVDAAIGKQDQVKKHKAQEANFIRVHAGKLDELINLVGELVIASSGVNLVARRAANADMMEAASTLERLVEEVRDGALKLRMVPIGETFSRYQRVVRDLGRELGKDVELIVSGTETELDKTMVEKISDPLMHLVRNALDHGIEPAAERTRRGKPARGRLCLNAYHETGSIVIEVADDGAGLDRERILARAIERGLAQPDQELGVQEIYKFILEPGFSTAESVTSVSGRGVGMDVVRRNIEALRGAVSIDSVAGEGTTIAVRLPLTLAIIDGFAVGVGQSAYVMPLEMVVECIELSGEDRARIRESGYINLRGEVLPLLRLRDVLEVTGEAGSKIASENVAPQMPTRYDHGRTRTSGQPISAASAT